MFRRFAIGKMDTLFQGSLSSAIVHAVSNISPGPRDNLFQLFPKVCQRLFHRATKAK
jgi:hypothetical protein